MTLQSRPHIQDSHSRADDLIVAFGQEEKGLGNISPIHTLSKMLIALLRTSSPNFCAWQLQVHPGRGTHLGEFYPNVHRHRAFV